MNTLLYARVSTDKQAEKELSIPAQLQAMREYARQRSWTVIEEFVEPGASAKTADRPILQGLLSKIRSPDVNVDVVLVHKIDRLARNVYDHATIKALLLQHHVRLASVVENVDDSVSGQLVENIMASIAQFYSANLADEVRKGMKQKVLKGGWPHMAPRGYLTIKGDTDEGASRIEPHPKEGPLMLQAFEHYATGWFSLKAVAGRLAKEGVTAKTGGPIPAAHIHRLLSNPFYIGRLRWKDLDVPGNHEALVSPELFDRVQRVLKRRFKNPGAKGPVTGFLLRGLAICASCRGHMTGGVHKTRWRYYQCARRSYNRALCPAVKYCKTTTAHAAIDQVCGQLQLSPSTVVALLQAVHEHVQHRQATDRRLLNSLRMKRTKLVEQEATLTSGFASGDVSPNAYKTAATKLRNQVHHLETEIRRLTQEPQVIESRVRALLDRAANVAELQEQLSESRRIELLRAVFKTIVLDDTGVVGFTLHPPFDRIFKMSPTMPSGDGSGPAAATPDIPTLASEIVRAAEDLPGGRLAA